MEPISVLMLYLAFWLVVVAIGLGTTIFWIVELIDVVRREFPDTNIKVIWVLVILLGHFIGSLVYYFVGRQQGQLPGAATRLY